LKTQSKKWRASTRRSVYCQPSVWQASDFVCFQEKDYKKHQYYLWLLDGGTKEYDEIEDEDEVT